MQWNCSPGSSVSKRVPWTTFLSHATAEQEQEGPNANKYSDQSVNGYRGLRRNTIPFITNIMSHLSGAEQSPRSWQKSAHFTRLTHYLSPSKCLTLQQRSISLKQSLSEEHAEVQCAFRKLHRMRKNTAVPPMLLNRPKSVFTFFTLVARLRSSFVLEGNSWLELKSRILKILLI